MDVPANQKLWNMLVTQAKAKFPKWPSLPASKWVHEEYVKHGGRFVSDRGARTAKQAHERATDVKKPGKDKDDKKEKDDK